jgi:hypothetical protein
LARKGDKQRGKRTKSELGERWTVRGVPSRLQKAAAACARSEGLTMGAWLSRLLEQAVAGHVEASEPPTDWRRLIESRLERLEEMLPRAVS